MHLNNLKPKTFKLITTPIFIILGITLLIAGLYFSVQIEKTEKINFEKQLIIHGLDLEILDSSQAITEYFKFFPLLIIALGFVFLQISYIGERREKEYEKTLSKTLRDSEEKLKASLNVLERFNEIMVNRELEMIKLKKEIKRIKKGIL
ncbi:hypothetical protein CVV26_03245 [Candidatus Kuenenbacteria bacterium HGW-Kuenenbacteria-1]|uniref:Uncharacterized protein n=1 Tax=Candidatus Kuenenbacteria bacterium HGW-Kuenenbacteria-1 TaxID=2013812 RepID=A0A2N1UMT2_9BACT|nr:MAG: hypothetical protein CVV26_03245 [Candidatus Kuenenbacteria bacterium HGW-Kuenenbacteria-1]